MTACRVFGPRVPGHPTPARLLPRSPLIVGVVVSFFTAVFVTQLLLHAAIEYQSLRRRRLWGVEERPADDRDGRAAARVTA